MWVEIRYYGVMYYLFLAIVIEALPQIGFAQTTGSLQGLITGIGLFLDQVLIPVILGIAFLSLVWNVFRFFILGADNEESQQNAKNLAFYSVLAFVLMLSFWGIVATLTSGIGLSNGNEPCEDRQSDYFNQTNLAPCRSIRPPANPNYSEPNVPDSTGVGTLTSDTGSGASPTLPHGDTAPTMPTNPPPPTTDTPLFDYSKISAYVDGIRTTTKSYFDTTVPSLFGANADAVKTALFADLPTKMSSGITDTDRAVAMYRLQQLGVVPLDTVPKFIAQVNSYNTSIGSPTQPLSTNAMQAKAAVPVALPAAVSTNMHTTRQGIIDGMGIYNMSAPAPIDISSAMTDMYNTSHTPAERWEKFQAYYTYINFDPNKTLYKKYLDDLNTEIIFNGGTTLITE